MSDVVRFENVGDIALITINNPPVNALSQAVRQGVQKAFVEAKADDRVRAIVLLGDGRAFIAGADITEFGKPPMEPHLPNLCDEIEASSKPVIASMHGVSLGGGLEVALGAHYRVATSDARVGLPEVHLGLIPGAGGTQRLPRLIGAEAAIEIMTTGRPVGAKAALKMGLLDRIGEGGPRENGLKFAQDLLAEGKGSRSVSALPGANAIDWDAAYDAVMARTRGQVSPGQAVRAVQAASEMSYRDGLAVERRIFMDLINTDQCKGMIHAFFSERAVSNLPELKGVAPRDLTSMGVIGGGTMGAGIATAALLSGLSVTLLEMSADAAEAAHGRIAGNLSGALSRGKIDQGQFDHLTQKALTLATQYDALSDVDLVIEAVFEEMSVKKEVFTKLDAVCRPGAILASNTSYLNIDEIAAVTSRPSDVIGLHFFSPAHVMKLLEVVVADKTALDVTATGFALGKRLNKISVRAGVCDGFIGNRILAVYRTAADHMILDGASPYDVDAALTEFGFAMGPYAVGDLAGLDIGWAVRKRKRAEGLDPRARMSEYPDRICEQGWFGQKTGMGYYDYSAGKKATVPNPAVMGFITEERASKGITPRTYAADEIVRKYMAAMVNEAAKVVGEGIARRPLDVDMVLLFGYGFPRYWGGPLKWADIVGLPELLADIEAWAAEDAYFWQPAPLLKQLVAEGRTFDDLNKA